MSNGTTTEAKTKKTITTRLGSAGRKDSQPVTQLDLLRAQRAAAWERTLRFNERFAAAMEEASTALNLIDDIKKTVAELNERVQKRIAEIDQKVDDYRSDLHNSLKEFRALDYSVLNAGGIAADADTQCEQQDADYMAQLAENAFEMKRASLRGGR